MFNCIRKHVGPILGSIFLIAMLFACSSSDRGTQSVQSEEVSYRLSATQLYEEYNANGVAAADKYEDKIVVVTGRVQSIDEDITGTPFIVIGGSGYLDGVQCMFSESQRGSVAAVSVGQELSIKGRVDGQVVGNVLLSNSIIQ